MATASWDQIERAIEHLHDAARSVASARDFYRQLLTEASVALDAKGGAVWQCGARSAAEPIVQSLADDCAEPDWSVRRELVEQAAAGGAATVTRHGSDCNILVCGVARAQPSGDGPQGAAAAAESPSIAPATVLELWLPAGGGAGARQGWLDFAAAVADIAADFQARDELRALRGSSALTAQAVHLLRRVSAPRTLSAAAYEMANEGRRALACDRLSVFVRRRGKLRLMAVSGVDAADRGGEFSRRAEALAEAVARWGDAVELRAANDDGTTADELPPALATALREHVDHAHARTLAAAPIRLPTANDARPQGRHGMVAIAESFDAGPSLRHALVQLGELVAPAMARTAELDHWPTRVAIGLTTRLARLRTPSRLLRALAVLGAVAAALALLVYLPVQFHVEALGRLTARTEREVFATATGAVQEVRVAHGDQVAGGDVLIVLRDPDLALELQATRGAIASARQRLTALAVTRTDRSLREDPATDRLPLAAEQRELEERLAGLVREEQLLEDRLAALTIRAPIAGQVLTRDVQTLLSSRPVERGEALLTIADVASGWELRADVPQRDIGHVLAAHADAATVAVAYRLAGDVQTTYPGHVTAVSAAAPLTPDGLRDEAAPIEVRIAIDGAAPSVARPGMTASVRIDCGRRSLGYVWLHNVGATLYRWATF